MKRSVPMYLFVSTILLLFIIMSINMLSKKHATYADTLPYYRNELQSEHTLYTFYVENEKNIAALRSSSFGIQFSSIEKKDMQSSEEQKATYSSPYKKVPDTIKVTLDMLTMDCGTIEFNLSLNEQGQYEGEGIPVMKGVWVATATIVDNEDEASKLSFLFDVK